MNDHLENVTYAWDRELDRQSNAETAYEARVSLLCSAAAARAVRVAEHYAFFKPKMESTEEHVYSKTLMCLSCGEIDGEHLPSCSGLVPRWLQ